MLFLQISRYNEHHEQPEGSQALVIAPVFAGRVFIVMDPECK